MLYECVIKNIKYIVLINIIKIKNINQESKRNKIELIANLNFFTINIFFIIDFSYSIKSNIKRNKDKNTYKKNNRRK